MNFASKTTTYCCLGLPGWSMVLPEGYLFYSASWDLSSHHSNGIALGKVSKCTTGSVAINAPQGVWKALVACCHDNWEAFAGSFVCTWGFFFPHFPVGQLLLKMPLRFIFNFFFAEQCTNVHKYETHLIWEQVNISTFSFFLLKVGKDVCLKHWSGEAWGDGMRQSVIAQLEIIISLR